MRYRACRPLPIAIGALVLGLAPSLRAAPPDLTSLDGHRATALELAAAARASAAGQLFRIGGLRDDRGRPMTLALEAAPLFAPGFLLEVDGDPRAGDPAARRFLFLRGTAEEWPRSSVALTLDLEEGRVDGLLATEEGLQELVVEPPAATLPLASGLRARGVELGNPLSLLGDDVVERPAVSEAAALTTGAAAAARVTPAPGGEYAARVAIDSDFELFDLLGGEDAVLAYLARTLHAVSEVYFRQMGVTLTVESIRLWSTPDDPWRAPNPHSSANAAVLCEFAAHWQRSRRSTSAFPRDAALFFTGKSSSDHGGQAFLASLCNYKARPGACPSGGYGTVIATRLGDAWDTYVIAHELGHIFGSPHTHCYSPPIDECFTGERACFGGATSTPADGGSVMSYCPRTTLSLGEPGRFGNASERVPARMRAFVDSLAGRCLVRTNDPYALQVLGAPGVATLSWVDPFGAETGWLVEQRSGKGKFKQVRVLPAGSTTVAIAKLKPGAHAFRVRARLGKNVSDYSAVVTVEVP
jgi:hypothetical protein